MNETTLSVVLPVYNAETTLVPTIQACLDGVAPHISDYEIIIVDDGSSDVTPTIANNLAGNYEPIMVIHHPHKRGYGCALMSGINAARGDIILMVNSGSTESMRTLARLLPYMEEYDMVTGYNLKRQRAWYQQLNEAWCTKLVNWSFGLDLHDVGSPIRLARAHIMHDMALQACTPLIFVELYARARQHNRSHIQVGLDIPAKSVRHNAYANIGLHLVWNVFGLWLHIRTIAQGQQAGKRQRFGWLGKVFLGAGVLVAGRGVRVLLRRRKTMPIVYDER